MSKGQPKLLTLTTPTVRNQKTLLWLQNQKGLGEISKWDAVVTSLSHYHRWYDENGRIVGIILLHVEGDQDEFLADLFQTASDVTLILMSRAVLSLKPADFWSENFDNVLCLEDLSENYPFLNAAWDGSTEDAVALFAHLCRYHRLVDCKVSRHPYPLTVVQGEIPAECWLVTQFFHHENPTRHAELVECLRRNAACELVDRVVLLNERDESAEWKGMPGSKITQVIISKRLTYAHFLQFVHDEVPKNVIVILANADMYFDSALLNLWSVKMEDRMMALLRWNVSESGESVIFGPRADSQDCWILLSDSVKEKEWPYATFDFPLGKPGCDNAFAAHMLRQRFLLCNPALTLKTHHLHVSDIRNYKKHDAIRSDLYINLVPTYLIDTPQVEIPTGLPQCICNELVSFEVTSSSLSNEITYCTMLEKEGRYKWEPSVENHYFEPAIPIYRWSHAAVTSNGLVYEPYRIYTGKQKEEFPYWAGATVDLFTPFQKRARMLALPFPDTTVFENSNVYLLYYVARYKRVLAEFPGTSFWLPPRVLPAVTPWIPLPLAVPFDGTSVWADEVVGFVPGALELGREDIQVLREGWTWQKDATEHTVVFLVNDILTKELVQEWLAPWMKQWTIRFVTQEDGPESVVGAAVCVVVDGTREQWSLLWALPEHSCVVEFQQELQLSGELQHLCHVADLQSWILLLSKGSVKEVHQQIVIQFTKWYKKNM